MNCYTCTPVLAVIAIGTLWAPLHPCFVLQANSKTLEFTVFKNKIRDKMLIKEPVTQHAGCCLRVLTFPGWPSAAPSCPPGGRPAPPAACPERRCPQHAPRRTSRRRPAPGGRLCKKAPTVALTGTVFVTTDQDKSS